MADTVFTKIIKREIPAEIIDETDEVICFLTLGPLNPGHLLVVPKEQIESIWDLPDNLYSKVMQKAKQMASLLQKYTDRPKIGMFVMGFGVPHAHVHIAPITEEQMAPIEKDIETASPEQLATVATELKKLL